MYRDFVSALRSCRDGDWYSALTTGYVEPNDRLLADIHYWPKGFTTMDSVVKRLEEMDWSRVRTLIGNIGETTRFEVQLTLMTENILARIGVRANQHDVYVIVGLDCTNIYSTDYQGRRVTVLCLESVDGTPDGLELLLSHEIHHWARQLKLDHDIFNSFLGERLVTEGLASCYSEEVQPGREPSTYCFVPASTADWVARNMDALDEVLTEERLLCADLVPMFLARTPPKSVANSLVVPPRSGYVYGYLKARGFLSRSGKTAQTATDVTWSDVLVACRS